jgi:hypothetical protein
MATNTPSIADLARVRAELAEIEAETAADVFELTNPAIRAAFMLGYLTKFRTDADAELERVCSSPLSAHPL